MTREQPYAPECSWFVETGTEDGDWRAVHGLEPYPYAQNRYGRCISDRPGERWRLVKETRCYAVEEQHVPRLRETLDPTL